MSVISKTFKAIFFTSILVVMIFSVIISIARFGYLDNAARFIFISGFKMYGVNAEITQVNISKKGIVIKEVKLKYDDDLEVEISNLGIAIKRFGLKIRSDVLCDVSIKNFGKYKFNMGLDKDLFARKSEISFHLSNQIDLSTSSFLWRVSHGIVEASGVIENLPIYSWKIAYPLLPRSVRDFLSYSIKSGLINKGTFSYNNIEKDSVSGNFVITDLVYKYSDIFPSVTKINTDVSIDEKTLECLIHQGYSNNTKIFDGKVVLDFSNFEDQKVVATARAVGNAVDFVDFILDDTYQQMKSAGIDLKQLSGSAVSTINLTIPLSEGKENEFDIKTKVTKAGIKIFSKSVELKNSIIEGKFDGRTVSLIGNGLINNFGSKIDFVQNIYPKANEEDYKLKIKSNIDGNRKDKIGGIKLLSGNSNLELTYLSKGGVGNLDISSDLKNLEFYIDKIAIYKKINDNATLNINGIFPPKSDGKININIVGNNNLKIIGNGVLNAIKNKISFSKIASGDTQLTGDLFWNKDSFKADLRGVKLDLSNANMMNYLEKEADNTNVDIKMDVQTIVLKRGIALKDFKLNIKCNPERCFEGYVDSKLGTKFFKMLLKTFVDKEQWVITCSNAGAILKGFDLYDKMKSGNLLVVLTTSRKFVSTGNIVPILDGSFVFKKFVLVDNPFLTRILSFTSFPGLINLIRNHKNIAFASMDGKFSYQNNIVDIKEAKSDGLFFEFSLAGKIDTSNRHVKLHGNIIPSIYGVNRVVRQIPFMGKLFSAPYSVQTIY